MGVVFRAEHIRLAREVAVKFLPDSLASYPGALERFRREARAVSRINYPHICTGYDSAKMRLTAIPVWCILLSRIYGSSEAEARG